MRVDPVTLNAVHAFMEVVTGRYDTKGAILFGSRARNTHRPDSDADVAVLLRGTRGKQFEVVLDLSGLAFDVLLETGILIQPLPIWEDEWNHPETFSNPQLLLNIAQ
jgi:predicted nucleotidyltransferase